MIPYLATIIVLLIITRRKKKEYQAPGALGLPYFREER
jgi:simple sugar transport system permease protein